MDGLTRPREGLYAAASGLPQCGLGLFTSNRRSSGEEICSYHGRILHGNPPKDADRTYLMRLGASVYIDAAEDLSAPGRYINDCRNSNYHNVRFDKRPQEGRAVVIATREINEGCELFADYGVLYWAGWRLMHPGQRSAKLS
ncbi:hypothetical protein FOZ62_001645 [Perkinsus olseni]|uniref:SET domain-containing protein n=1 Tax=Perkinsus olseni TaxID=32597 RepID=A0A7J6TFG2_PEROL|nr:hypothetical protein FOZ62_001645 [Perkinsus olseni]